MKEKNQDKQQKDSGRNRILRGDFFFLKKLKKKTPQFISIPGNI